MRECQGTTQKKMPDNAQRSEARESKTKQGHASKSMGKQGKARDSTRELRSLALLARFARVEQDKITKSSKK